MGSLSNDSGDGNENGKKAIGLSFVYTYIPDRASLYTHKRTARDFGAISVTEEQLLHHADLKIESSRSGRSRVRFPGSSQFSGS